MGQGSFHRLPRDSRLRMIDRELVELVIVINKLVSVVTAMKIVALEVKQALDKKDKKASAERQRIGYSK